MAAMTTPNLQEQRKFDLAMAQLDPTKYSSKQRPIVNRHKTPGGEQEAISAAAQALFALWQKR